MIQTIKNLLGIGVKTDYAQLIKDGAIILDVRSKGEYAIAHIPGSLNISVDTLAGQMKKLPSKSTPIITCCASGMRSGVAKNLLKANGYTHVINGGNWFNLQKKI